MKLAERIRSLNKYRPATKLREDNVFSCVCLSVILSTGGVHVTISMMYWTSPYRDYPLTVSLLRLSEKSFISPLNFDLFSQNLDKAHYFVNEPPRPVVLCRCHPQCFYLFKAMYLLKKYKSSLQRLLGRKSSCFVTQQRPVHNNVFKNGSTYKFF